MSGVGLVVAVEIGGPILLDGPAATDLCAPVTLREVAFAVTWLRLPPKFGPAEAPTGRGGSRCMDSGIRLDCAP